MQSPLWYYCLEKQNFLEFLYTVKEFFNSLNSRVDTRETRSLLWSVFITRRAKGIDFLPPIQKFIFTRSHYTIARARRITLCSLKWVSLFRWSFRDITTAFTSFSKMFLEVKSLVRVSAPRLRDVEAEKCRFDRASSV